jgi:hypothetical protein
MQYAPEFHTALITVSSIFILVAGIMVTILVSRETTIKLLPKTYIQLALGSIAFGIISIICALVWFVVMNEVLTQGAILALIFQSIAAFVPLWQLIGHFEKPKRPERKEG